MPMMEGSGRKFKAKVGAARLALGGGVDLEIGYFYWPAAPEWIFGKVAFELSSLCYRPKLIV